MPQIKLLGQSTIDQIAAGEVVERPSSVVKELVENAIDAGAAAVTVEIKEGGIDLIRVTDNGCGIEKEQIERAFLRHATSKIQSAADLSDIQSLGFRGEALSSIAAVSEVEVITKSKDALTGIRYILRGGENPQIDEIGAPDGTTFLIRNLFFNVPVRKKFLKQAATEGGYIADLMEHMALSRPDISFKFTNNGRVRFHTSGKGDLKEVIYRIYGRDVVNGLLPVSEFSDSVSGNLSTGGMKSIDGIEDLNGIKSHGSGRIQIEGYLGKPEWNRANRNFEFFFVNGRYIRSDLLSKGLEEGYRQFLMQHKFPFAVLQIKIDAGMVDVNVHPSKMEIRFIDEPGMMNFLSETVKKVLRQEELIVSTKLVKDQEAPSGRVSAPEPFEILRIKKEKEQRADFVVAEDYEYNLQAKQGNVQEENLKMQDNMQKIPVLKVLGTENSIFSGRSEAVPNNIIKAENHILVERPVQMDFFEDKFLSHDAKSQYEILGQIFGTYWLVSFGERLVFIDQHAAHEKVKYERLIKDLSQRSVTSQMISPPVIVQLSGREEAVLKEYWDSFTVIGFEIEEFGENAYALRSVPSDLYGCQEEEFFCGMLDELAEGVKKDVFAMIDHRIASVACKAAVKGKQVLSREELQSLIEELIGLENPYYCPHGRPTMISMSQYEIEKKFKRIL